MRKAEFEFLTSFESVKRLKSWLLRKAGRKEWFSDKSFLQYLEALRMFMRFTNAENPDKLVEMLTDPNKCEAVLNEYVGQFAERGWSPSFQINSFGYLKRFLLSNGIEIEWKKIALPKMRRVIQDKAPDKNELRKIVMYAPSWLKPVILMLKDSGMRVGALQGLKMKNVKLDYDSQVGLVEIPPELNKARVGYYTFFTEESKDALKKHFEARKKKGEELTPESPLIKPSRNAAITYECLRLSYTRTLKRADLSKKSQKFNVLHLHSLRKFFRTSLEAALTRSQIERLMGHVSTEYLDGAYFRPPEKDMLEAYRKAIPNLTIMEDVVSEDFQKKQLLRQAALILGEEKLKVLKDILARTKNLDQAVEEFRKFKDESSTMNDGNGKKYHIAKGEAELIQMLGQGYRLVQSLNHDKYVLELQ